MADESADVIVVGGGGAGLAAAAEAASAGCRVLLLEKNAAPGGSTEWAIGSVSASNTRHQRAAGIDDSTDLHFEDLGLLAGKAAKRDNLALRRLFVDHVAETFEWLLGCGLVFIGPALEPPHRRPRMHNVVPSSRAFPYHLQRRCRRLGVAIRTSVRARSLVAENGCVTGVVTQDRHGIEQRIRATRGVVLATGDYSASDDLKKRYLPASAAAGIAVNAASTGDGHLLALALGAAIVNGDLVNGPSIRFVPPDKPSLIGRLPPYTVVGQVASFAMAHLPPALLRPLLMNFATTVLGADAGLFRAGAILVNAHGRRFTDECDAPAGHLGAQPDGIGYIVMSGDIGRKFEAWPHFVSTAPNVAYAYLPDYRRNRRDICHEAPDARELARRLNLDAVALAASMRQGGAAGAIADRDLVALGPVKSYIVHTDGGLAVSEKLEVLGPGRQPIPGLYAAGSTGQGGLLLYGHGHHLAWAFVSGRLAGRAAASAPTT